MRQAIKSVAYRSLTAILGDQQGFVRLPVLAGPASGLQFRLDLIHRRESAYFLGKYDRGILTQLAAICQPGWTVWDCGTYLGFYTCFFARTVGKKGKVVAVEPDPRNLARTQRHVDLNGLANVEYRQLAVGNPAGEVDFILRDNSNSHLPGTYVGAHPQEESPATRITVQTVGLDQAYRDLGLPRPSLIKLDIEGAEKLALQTLDYLVREVKPLIVLELHNPECDEQAWKFHNQTGYQLYSLDQRCVITDRKNVQGTLLCSPT